MAATSDHTIINYCILFLLSLISTFVVRYLIISCIKYSTAIQHPPSPPALPIIGHLHLVGSPFPLSFQTLARRYGTLLRIRLVSSTFVVASTAAIAKEIFKTHDLHFASRFELGPTDYNIYKGTGFIAGPYDAYWQFMKKLCMTQLFGSAQYDRFKRIQEKEVENLLKSLMKLAKEGEPCDLNVAFETLTNNFICKLAMSKRFAENNDENEAKKMRKLVSEIMDTGAKLGVSEVFGLLKKIDLFGHGKKLMEAMWKYDEVIEQLMKDYEENLVNIDGENAEKDVMDILLQTYRNTNSEMKLTRIQIKHFILELFMSSIDTQSAAIQWTMAELINHPRVFSKLREEVDSVVNSSRLVKESDTPNLPYLQAIVKESLRLHPPGTIIGRECTKDCKINGFDIKAKTKVLINAYAIMRDPGIWTDPDEFMPERFLINATGEFDQLQMEMRSNECSYLPFGGGRRKCVGSAYAYTLMHATIGALVQCFDWKVTDGEKIDINISNGFSGTMAPPLVCYPITHYNPF